MADSFLRVTNNAIKSLAFTKFKDDLGLTDSNTDMVFAPKEIAMRKLAEKRGKASVDFISLWRTSVNLDWKRQNTSVARRGINIEYTSSIKTEIVTVKAVPARLDYNIWLWSLDPDKVMHGVETYLFWYQRNPNLIFNYNGLYPLEIDLHFGQVVDESTVTAAYESGSYYVSRLPLTIDGWIFDLVSTKTVLQIILDVYLREGQSPDFVDTLLDEYIIEAA